MTLTFTAAKTIHLYNYQLRAELADDPTLFSCRWMFADKNSLRFALERFMVEPVTDSETLDRMNAEIDTGHPIPLGRHSFDDHVLMEIDAESTNHPVSTGDYRGPRVPYLGS